MLGMRLGAVLLLGGLATPALAHGGHEHGLGLDARPVLVVPLALSLLILRGRLAAPVAARLQLARRRTALSSPAGLVLTLVARLAAARGRRAQLHACT